jgi:hypothetical protein
MYHRLSRRYEMTVRHPNCHVHTRRSGVGRHLRLEAPCTRQRLRRIRTLRAKQTHAAVFYPDAVYCFTWRFHPPQRAPKLSEKIGQVIYCGHIFNVARVIAASGGWRTEFVSIASHIKIIWSFPCCPWRGQRRHIEVRLAIRSRRPTDRRPSQRAIFRIQQNNIYAAFMTCTAVPSRIYIRS